MLISQPHNATPHLPAFTRPTNRLSQLKVQAVAADVSSRVWWMMLISSSMALVTSGYLAWASLTSGAVAGCGGGGIADCSSVLNSRWSTVLSIPVSIPAIAIHTLIVGFLLIRPATERIQQIRWTTIGLSSLTAGASALWFPIAVWNVDDTKFTSFHDYLFAAKPSYAQAFAKASTPVDRTKLEQTLAGPIPGDYIAKHVRLYEKAGAGAIPKLMFPETTIVGAVENPAAMIRLIERYLARQPPANL